MKKTALVVIDMLNAYDFEDADRLAESVRETLPKIRALLDRAKERDVPVIYVNDNYGDWNSSAEELVEEAKRGRFPDLVEEIEPDDDAKFVIKGRHSIFYGTPMEYLLKELEIDRLVMVGQVTEQCILYSALDAYIRDLDVAVPRDAVAHIEQDLADAALRMMEVNMDADVEPSERCVL
ncbi:MAG TPA: isochorismatase family cysteine hydrolase [Solirubrobacteraceae bacterium]|jgi:nicotinamidase-related amidase